MLQKPTIEIENEVLAEYDRDYVMFGAEVMDGIEKTNPGMAEAFYNLLDAIREDRSFILGIQMATAVYKQLERASGGNMPIVEMREAVGVTAFEILDDPEDFLNKYGTPYLQEGLIGLRTLSNFLGDAVGHGAEPHKVVFIAVYVIRLLEAQVELDMSRPKSQLN